MPTRSDNPRALQEFAGSLGARDPKTVTTYLTTVRDFVAWLALQPGGTPFHLGLVTEIAVRGYMDFLATANRAPRTRSKALSGLHRFCQWAVDEVYWLIGTSV
jgi:site-specific recombinase XerD